MRRSCFSSAALPCIEKLYCLFDSMRRLMVRAGRRKVCRKLVGELETCSLRGMASKFADLPEEIGERVKLCIPAERPRQDRAGRPPLPDRVVMSGILYRLRTGCQWDALPA